MKTKWETKKLGDVCEKGSSNVSQNKIKDNEGKYPIYGAKGLIKNVDFYHQDKPYISIIKDGAGIGRVNLRESKTSVIGTLQYIFPKENIDINFLYYFLLGIDFAKYSKGAAIPHIYFKDYKNEELVVPSLPEQKAIVKILDETFESLKKAKETAEKNLLNAKELFESYLEEVFSNPKEDWEEKKLGEVCEIFRGGSPRPIKSFLTDSKEGINWVKIGDTKDVDKYIYKTKQKIIPEGIRRSRLVEKGDFILSNSMSFGRPYIMATKGCIHDGWLVLKDYHEKLDIDFLYFLLGSRYMFVKFSDTARGSTVRNLNIDRVKAIKILIPPLKQQKAIVSKLDALSKEIKELETIYNKKVENIEELKKAVLKKAFAGELTN